MKKYVLIIILVTLLAISCVMPVDIRTGTSFSDGTYDFYTDNNTGYVKSITISEGRIINIELEP